MLIGGVAFTFLVASFGIGTAACESAAKFSANLAVKTATTLCASVFYDGDTNHFFVAAIAFEAPAGISSTVAIGALNRDQPRKALASKDRAILGSGHRRLATALQRVAATTPGALIQASSRGGDKEIPQIAVLGAVRLARRAN